MRLPQLSVRSILLLTVGALTLIIFLLAAIGVYNNWQRLSEIQRLRGAALLSDQLFDATELLSVERDLAVSMLERPDTESVENLRERLLENRKGSDHAFSAAIDKLRAYSFPDLDSLRRSVLARLPAIKLLRQQIDRNLKLPQSGRDRALTDRWTDEVSQLSIDTEKLWVKLVRHFTNIDPIATQNLRYKHFLSTIINRTGQERSIIGRLIAENKGASVAQIAQLSRSQGVMEESWTASRILAENTGIYGEVESSYSDAVSHYATLHDMVENLFYVPTEAHQGQYPIDSDLWFELSTELSDSLMTLRRASIAAAHRYLAKLIEAAQTAIAVQAAILLTALLICAYGFFMVVRRVIGPVNAMADALLSASRGEPVALTLPENRNDEIGKLAHVLHAFQLSTEKIKQTSALLDRSESQLRAVADHTVDGMITVDAAGAIISYNPACERIFGYSPEEVLGRDLRSLVTVPSQGTLNAYFLSCLDSKTGEDDRQPSREIYALRKDGSHSPIEVSLCGFRLDGQQHFSAIVRDITRRKEAELEILHHTRALERSNKELDDFAYIASHDLKEPLRGIHNHARFLLEDNAEKLDAESVGRLSRLVYLSQRMERLVNDLLYFSRLGRHELAIQQTNLADVISDIESTLDVFLAERGARIVIATALPEIVSDKTRVTELFRNLITNAVKYNDKPEKTIEIGWLAEQATPEGHVERNVFYVKDDGRGIDHEFHTEIFRIFKRLQGTSEKEEGTGVGLTFVKKIVERHGGKIWLQSELGKGTIFFFTLEASRHEHELDSQIAA
jgi:PAS domain S-box-containing protein